MKTTSHRIQNQPNAGFVKQALIAAGLLGTPLFLSLVLSSLMTFHKGEVTESLDLAAEGAEIPLSVNQAVPEFRAIWTLLLPKIEARG